MTLVVHRPVLYLLKEPVKDLRERQQKTKQIHSVRNRDILSFESITILV